MVEPEIKLSYRLSCSSVPALCGAYQKSPAPRWGPVIHPFDPPAACLWAPHTTRTLLPLQAKLVQTPSEAAHPKALYHLGDNESRSMMTFCIRYIILILTNAQVYLVLMFLLGILYSGSDVFQLSVKEHESFLLIQLDKLQHCSLGVSCRFCSSLQIHCEMDDDFVATMYQLL